MSAHVKSQQTVDYRVELLHVFFIQRFGVAFQLEFHED